jgi:hypothetical protein
MMFAMLLLNGLEATRQIRLSEAQTIVSNAMAASFQQPEIPSQPT